MVMKKLKRERQRDPAGHSFTKKTSELYVFTNRILVTY